MKTEQLKQAALKATPGPWRYDYMPGYCGELIANNGKCVASFNDEPTAEDATHFEAANPATILALLECVDALRDMLEQFTKTPSTLKDSQVRVKGHAALQKLEAL